MTSIEVGEVNPTDTNARVIVELTYRDLINAGMPFNKVIKLADPLSNESIYDQLGRLYKHPGRYAGASLVDEDEDRSDLLGVVKYSPWNRADQAPYVNVFSRVAQRSIAMLGWEPNKEKSMPLGIFALLAKPESRMPHIDEEILDGLSPQEHVYKRLIDKVITEAGGRAVFMSMYPQDPSESQVVNGGFEPTGKWGKIVGIKQQLYIRPASSAEDLAA